MKKRFFLALISSFLLVGQVFAATFPDVAHEHKNFYAIEVLKASGVIGGYPDGTFKPDGTINRAEFAKILVGAITDTDPTLSEYSNCFPDVKTEWFAPFVCYAKEKGWIAGYPDGTFKPTQNVNRAEALKMLFESTEPGSADTIALSDNLFTDVPTDAWFAKYVNLAQIVQMTEEKSGSFHPGDAATRGVVAEYIFRDSVVSYTGQPYDDIQMGAYFVANNLTDLYTADSYESPLEITTFMTDPEYFGESAEYVEIRNNGSTSIDLDGYYLTGESLTLQYWYTLTNVSLAPGASLRVYSSEFNAGSDLWDDYSDINLYDPNGNLEAYYG